MQAIFKNRLDRLAQNIVANLLRELAGPAFAIVVFVQIVQIVADLGVTKGQ